MTNSLWAATTGIDSTDKWSYGNHIGYVNFKSAQGGDVTVTEDGIYGYIWAENIGWIKLACDGNPPYENTSNSNWGVNNDGSGNLSGFAWNDNAGWINFSSANSRVVIDLESGGDFSGYGWGENVGWINFAGTAVNSDDYHVNLIAPDLPSDLQQFANGSTLPWGALTNDATPTFQFDLSHPSSGTVIKYQLQLADNSGFSPNTVDYTEGSGSQTPRNDQQYSPSALSSGNFYWRVKCIDEFGVGSSWAIANSGDTAFILDADAPGVPLITEFTYNSTGEITSISGTAEAYSTVNVYDGGVYIGQTTADENGDWTYTPGTPLDDGPHTISAIAEDAATNPSDNSYYYNLNQVLAVNVFKDTTTTHDSSATSLRLEKEASYNFKFAVNDGLTPNPDEPIMVSAWVRKNASYGSHTDPTITLTGLSIDGTGNSTASGGAEGSWTEFTVTGTPNAKGVVTLRVETFSTESNAAAWIDDISITQ